MSTTTNSTTPHIAGPDTATAYERLGGAAGVRELVDRFYQAMDTLPQARAIRRMHNDDLEGPRDKLYLFLSGWLGGPNLYQQRYGHPRLRARHLPFTIGTDERDQWLQCMDHALNAMDIEDDLRRQLHRAFFMTADFMRNRRQATDAA